MRTRTKTGYVVLVAIDTDGGDSSVVSTALDLAAGQQAELHVLTVVPETEVTEPAAAREAQLQDVAERLRARVATQLEELRRRNPAAAARLSRIQVHCTVGAPASEIIWLAAHVDADVVIVGTHERRERRRLMLGAVAERVARVCGCPVWVVRDKHHAAPWRVPETEPSCADCAEGRRISSGNTLFCPRHLARHAHAHVATLDDFEQPAGSTASGR